VLYPVTITLGQMKARLLRPQGKASDPDALASAGEILQSLIDKFNTRRDWKFLRGTTAYNVTSNGLITLNTTTSRRFKKIYSVIGPIGPLTYSPQRDYDVQTQGLGTTALGGMLIYTAFTIGSTDKILVRDAPSATTSVTVNYQTLATLPVTDNATFSDLPEPVGNWLYCEGRARVYGEMGGNTDQARYWQGQALQAWQDLMVFDNDYFPDHVAQFIPQSSSRGQTQRYGYVWDMP